MCLPLGQDRHQWDYHLLAKKEGQIGTACHTAINRDYVFLCSACVLTPQSLRCGVRVGGQHWETSVWLGWTGPSAGSAASQHNPAETHRHGRCNIKLHTSISKIPRQIFKDSTIFTKVALHNLTVKNESIITEEIEMCKEKMLPINLLTIISTFFYKLEVLLMFLDFLDNLLPYL